MKNIEDLQAYRSKKAHFAMLLAMDKAVETGKKQWLGTFKGIDVWVVAGSDLEHERYKLLRSRGDEE